jgi:hypothetical protein
MTIRNIREWRLQKMLFVEFLKISVCFATRLVQQKCNLVSPKIPFIFKIGVKTFQNIELQVRLFIWNN